MIFIIDSDPHLSSCISRACQNLPNGICKIFPDAISAISALDSDHLPDLIFLEIMLDGPDGFTFLNELASYPDTARIPIVLISSLNLQKYDLSPYGVVAILNKETMRPAEIQNCAKKYLAYKYQNHNEKYSAYA